MHYLNHLPEFVNEVFEEHQMETIKEDFWNYVKKRFDGPKLFGFEKGTKVNRSN